MKRINGLATGLVLICSTVLCVTTTQPSAAQAGQSMPTAVRLRSGSKLGMLSFPTINVKRPLIVGIGDSSLARGLGLWPDTAVPGDPGNAVIAGHRTSHGAPMRYIDRLKIGDPIYFTTTGPHPTTYEFRITKRQVVRPNALWITRQSVASTLTIFACHPPHSIAYRFVVFAKLVTDAQHAGR